MKRFFALHLVLIMCGMSILSAQIIETLRPPVKSNKEVFVNTNKQHFRSDKPPVLIEPEKVVMAPKWDITLSQRGIEHGSEIPQSRMDSIKMMGNILKSQRVYALDGIDQDTVRRDGLMVTPQLGVSFKGNAFNGWAPPDNHLAVSDAGFLVSVINTSLLFADGAGNILFEENFSDFLSFLELTGIYFDPKVLYDPVEDKFIMVVLNGNTPATSTIVIGFSTSSDPNEAWWFYTFTGNPTGEDLWFDYPSIGVSTDDLYVSGNLYTANRTYKQVFIYQIEKEAGYAGEELSGTSWNDVRDAYGAPDFTVVPVSFGFDGSVGPGIYLISTDASGGSEAMMYYTDANARNNPDLHVFSAEIPRYHTPFDGIMKGTTDKLATNDCRTLTAFYADGTIHFAFNIWGDDLHTKVQYCRLNTAELTQTTLVFGQQPFEYAYPSIVPFTTSVTDKSVLIGFLRTGGSIYPEFRVASCDHDMNYSGSILVKEGESFTNFLLNGTTERWGDYTGMARKHSAAGPEVWVSGCYGEDMDSGEPNVLSTWIAQITDGQVSTVPQALFTGDPTELTVGQAVSFSDHSTNAPTSWLWSFPGGTPATSQQQNPIVTYHAPGIYDVTLRVSNASGQDEEQKTGYIHVSETIEIPVAGFTSDATELSPGGSVTFTDISANEPTEWDWFFDGGVPAISHVKNPIVIYPEAGCFDVTLIASNAAGTDVLSRQCYIDVLATAVDEAGEVLRKFALYPNPVSDGPVIIDFEIPEAMELEVAVVDAQGRLVKILLQRRIKEGLNTVSFSPEPLVPGTYFLAILDKNKTLVKSAQFIVQD